jgi:uncharacterized protein YndB with AHSA1/START domain
VTEPLRRSFTVACSPEHGFHIWTGRISLWWAAGHTVTAEAGLEIVLEPRVGGRIFECTRGGREEDWGEVVVWEPPRRVGYLWHLRADRADATEVEVAFNGQPDGTTRVDIEHRGWDRLGDRGPAWRERNERGWSGLIPHYIDACKE